MNAKEALDLVLDHARHNVTQELMKLDARPVGEQFTDAAVKLREVVAFVEGLAEERAELDVLVDGDERFEWEREEYDLAVEAYDGVIHDARKLLGLPETREEEV